ncbi:MAG: hypothetical protein JSV04_07285 [Candidatus Heimdallarchaeota archaeon]|nr:MAG: hypothetical protein JSV04_07285 [Candidatus Heimdallarchaeota archaeon]
MIDVEKEVKKTVTKISRNTTYLLVLAVILFSITNTFGVVSDPTTGNPSVYIFGTTALADKNVIYIEGVGALFGLISAILMFLVNLCASLSFAVVCFDEKRNIWFRVVAVAALMLILYGGLNIL